MIVKLTHMVARNDGALIETEAHTSRKLCKLIVTKSLGDARRTITHKASGWAMTSLLPVTMRTIPELIAFAEALEALEHPAWAILDRATTSKGVDRKNMSGRDVDHLRDFASKARAIGIEIAVKAHSHT